MDKEVMPTEIENRRSYQLREPKHFLSIIRIGNDY